MSVSFQNKKVLVSGAGGELGSAICRAFALRGAAVAGLAHRRPAPDCAELSLTIDLREGDAVPAAVRSVEEKFGSVDILVNNAGITRDGLLPARREEDIHELLAVNLAGTLSLCRAVLPGMVSRRGGCILNISSLAAHHPLPGQAAYAASKGGIESLTRALAVEYAPRRIRVNAVAPGFLESGLLQGMDEGRRKELLKKIPAGRWGTVNETAETVVFLCSDAASYITGQVVCVDGGLGM